MLALPPDGCPRGGASDRSAVVVAVEAQRAAKSLTFRGFLGGGGPMLSGFGLLIFRFSSFSTLSTSICRVKVKGGWLVSSWTLTSPSTAWGHLRIRLKMGHFRIWLKRGHLRIWLKWGHFRMSLKRDNFRMSLKRVTSGYR